MPASIAMLGDRKFQDCFPTGACWGTMLLRRGDRRRIEALMPGVTAVAHIYVVYHSLGLHSPASRRCDLPLSTARTLPAVVACFVSSACGQMNEVSLYPRPSPPECASTIRRRTGHRRTGILSTRRRTGHRRPGILSTINRVQFDFCDIRPCMRNGRILLPSSFPSH